MANIDRLEFDQSKGKDVTAELASRRALVKRYREAGIVPSPGLMVFAQLDKKKTRQVGTEELKDLLVKLKYDGDTVSEIMSMLDQDGDGFIDEKEWEEGLARVPKLLVALEKDIDPESGKLKSMITAGKAAFDMLRKQGGAYAVDNKEVARFMTAWRHVYGLGDAEPGKTEIA